MKTKESLKKRVSKQLKNILKKDFTPKYNIFKSNHPKKSLRGKLFYKLKGNRIRLLTTQKTITVDKSDLRRDLYHIADAG